MTQDTPEFDLRLLRKAVVELFDRGGLSLPFHDGNAHLLHSEHGPTGKTLRVNHVKQIERALYSIGRRMP